MRAPKHNKEAIETVTRELVRCENKLLEIRQQAARHDFEQGFDRDTYNYRLGGVCMLRHILVCLGVSPLDIDTAVTVKLQALDGR